MKEPTKIWDCPREVPPAVTDGTVVAWKGRLYECVPLRKVVGKDHSGGWCPTRWPQGIGLEDHPNGLKGSVPDERSQHSGYNPAFMQEWLCWVPWSGNPRPTITDDEAGQFYAQAFHNFCLACRALGVEPPAFSPGDKVSAKAKAEAREGIAEILKGRK